jgi:hypothetical protein
VRWGRAIAFVVAALFLTVVSLVLVFVGLAFLQGRLSVPVRRIKVETAAECAPNVVRTLKDFASSKGFSFTAGNVGVAEYDNGQLTSDQMANVFSLTRWDAGISGSNLSPLRYEFDIHSGGQFWRTSPREADALANALMLKLKSLTCIRNLAMTPR